MQVLYAVVVAGGQGTRIGFKKQFALLADRPLWQWSVDAFLRAQAPKVWLVVPEADVPVIKRTGLTSYAPDTVRVIAGGETRWESVRQGIRAVFAEVRSEVDDFHVAVHDAARPFVTAPDIARVYEAARERGGAILAKPCTDTMKRASHMVVTDTVPRTELWHAQTPQIFSAEWLQRAYFGDRQSAEATDDAEIMERLGHSVHIIESNHYNEKITTASDMEFAEWWAQRTLQKGGHNEDWTGV